MSVDDSMDIWYYQQNQGTDEWGWKPNITVPLHLPPPGQGLRGRRGIFLSVECPAPNKQSVIFPRYGGGHESAQ